MSSKIPMTLTITTLQPMAIAGDSATGTWANLDIVTDAHGLPFVPRSRLNARLRAAAAIAVRAHQDADLLETTLELLGAHGSHHESPRMLQVDNAQFDDTTRAMVAATLADLRSQNPDWEREAATHALTARVTDASTTVLTQTAVARDRTPDSGTLRSLRVLREGTTLTAALRWARPPEPKHTRALALAVLAINQLGAGAGVMGRVTVVLDNDRDATLRLAGWAQETEADA